MAKLLSCLVLAVMALGVSSVWGKEEGWPRKGTIVANKLTIRSRPGVHYESLGSFAKGDAVTVVSEKGGWLEVVLPADCLGWVPAEALNEAGEVLMESCPIYSGPAVVFNSFGKVARGTRLDRVDASSKKWFRIKVPQGMTAWINGDYVALEENAGTSVPEEKNAAEAPKTAETQTTAEAPKTTEAQKAQDAARAKELADLLSAKKTAEEQLAAEREQSAKNAEALKLAEQKVAEAAVRIAQAEASAKEAESKRLEAEKTAKEVAHKAAEDAALLAEAAARKAAEDATRIAEAEAAAKAAEAKRQAAVKSAAETASKMAQEGAGKMAAAEAAIREADEKRKAAEEAAKLAEKKALEAEAAVRVAEESMSNAEAGKAGSAEDKAAVGADEASAKAVPVAEEPAKDHSADLAALKSEVEAGKAEAKKMTVIVIDKQGQAVDKAEFTQPPTFEGYVIPLGANATASATHVLYEKSDVRSRPLCFLFSRRLPIHEWNHRRVEVSGNLKLPEGWTLPVLNVARIVSK